MSDIEFFKECQHGSLVSSWQVAETWRKLIQMKQEEGAEKAELHQLWKKMIHLLKDTTQSQDNKTEQLVMLVTPTHLDMYTCIVQPKFK